MIIDVDDLSLGTTISLSVDSLPKFCRQIPTKFFNRICFATASFLGRNAAILTGFDTLWCVQTKKGFRCLHGSLRFGLKPNLKLRLSY